VEGSEVGLVSGHLAVDGGNEIRLSFAAKPSTTPVPSAFVAECRNAVNAE
jgi:hypothetical protein